MCMFDYTNPKKAWREDPNMSLNDNLFFGSVHFTQVFFMRYRVHRHNNENDFDDMAADCSLAVYESVKKHIDTWDRNYRLDQYIYYRAWSVVGNWIKNYFLRKQREPIDVKIEHKNRLGSIEMDVGRDELDSTNFDTNVRYTVWKTAPLLYYEKKLSSAAQEYLDYRDECIDMGIEPVDPEDFLTNRNSLETDLRYLNKILNEENPNPRVTKKEVRVSLGKVKHSS